MGFLNDIAKAYDDGIVDPGRQPEFFLFISFLVTWTFIRTSAHMIRAQVSWWPGDVQTKGGLHIHHLVWGICAMMIVGYVAIAFYPSPPVREVLAVFFGIGMGLTLDEFALWLNLKDVYWETQGRESIDAVVVVAALGGLLLFGYRVWIDLAEREARELRVSVGALIVVAIVIAIVNVLKRKHVLGVVSLVLPPVGLVGAVRLAKPNSIWARRYDKGKLARSRERFPPPPAKAAAAKSPA